MRRPAVPEFIKSRLNLGRVLAALLMLMGLAAILRVMGMELLGLEADGSINAYQLKWGWRGFALVATGILLYQASREGFLSHLGQLKALRGMHIARLLLAAFFLGVLTFVFSQLKAVEGARVYAGLYLFLAGCLHYTGLLLFRPSPATPDSAVKEIADGKEKKSLWLRSALVTGVSIVLFYLVGNEQVYPVLPFQAQLVLQDILVPKLAKWETSRIERNYYENLIRTGWVSSEHINDFVRPHYYNDRIQTTRAGRVTGDFFKLELTPSQKVVFLGQVFTTNRWGMRDRDYMKEKDPAVFRMALLGPSLSMGLGVADEETFEWVLEERLNRKKPAVRYSQYEILNFSVSDYTALHYATVIEKKVLEFKPDAVFIMGHMDHKWSITHVIGQYELGNAFPHEYLNTLIEKADIAPNAAAGVMRRSLEAYQDEMLLWGYGKIVEICRRNGILPVWFFTPLVGKPHIPGDTAAEKEKTVTHLAALAEQAGFLVLSLTDAYDGHEEATLKIEKWDPHPNALGHRLIAERLYEQIRQHPEIFEGSLPAVHRGSDAAIHGGKGK